MAFAKSAKNLKKKYKSLPDDIENFKNEFQKTDILLVDIYDKSEIESIPEERMTFIVKSYIDDAIE